MVRRIARSFLWMLLCASGARAVCPAGAWTSLFFVGPSSFRQSGFSTAMDWDVDGTVFTVIGDNFFGVSPLFFAGAGFVYRGTPDGSGYAWTFESMIRASDIAAFDQSGDSVAIDVGSMVTLAAIGAELDDGAGADSGSAAVFRREIGGTWTEEAVLRPADASASDKFGSWVALDESRLIVGAPGDDDAGLESGSAYVFARSVAGAWALEQKLTWPVASPNSTLGDGVAIDGMWSVAGAPGDDTLAFNAGAVVVWRGVSNGMGGVTWSHHSTLRAPTPTTSEQFGFRVALDGDLLLVGAPLGGPIGAGVAYVYRRVVGGMGGETWEYEATLGPGAGEGAGGDRFGFSVDLDRGLAVVGAVQDDEPGDKTGSAYVFLRTMLGGVATWPAQRKLVLPAPMPSDDFGWSCGVARGVIAIGASAQDQYGGNWGNTLTMTAPLPPVILEGPVSQSAAEGAAAMFGVSAAGRGALTYQWFKDGLPLMDGGSINGSVTAMLTISAAAPEHAGVYRVDVTGECGVNAADAMLEVIPPAACVGDANGDRMINFADVTSVLAEFGELYAPGTGPGDANLDGRVDFADITSVLSRWGMPCDMRGAR